MMLRADALQAIYPELKDRIVVTIMGAVAAELYMLGHRAHDRDDKAIFQLGINRLQGVCS